MLLPQYALAPVIPGEARHVNVNEDGEWVEAQAQQGDWLEQRRMARLKSMERSAEGALNPSVKGLGQMVGVVNSLKKAKSIPEDNPFESDEEEDDKMHNVSNDPRMTSACSHNLQHSAASWEAPCSGIHKSDGYRLVVVLARHCFDACPLPLRNAPVISWMRTCIRRSLCDRPTPQQLLTSCRCSLLSVEGRRASGSRLVATA